MLVMLTRFETFVIETKFEARIEYLFLRVIIIVAINK